jgi:ATP-dependent DNA ligase
VLLLDIARTSEALATTSARLTKIGLLADCLRRAEPAEVPLAVAFLSGVLPQRQIGVGYAALRDLPAPAAEESLTVGDVDDAFARIGAVAGPGSTGERRRLLADLFGRATCSPGSCARARWTGSWPRRWPAPPRFPAPRCAER